MPDDNNRFAVWCNGNTHKRCGFDSRHGIEFFVVNKQEAVYPSSVAKPKAAGKPEAIVMGCER